MKKSSIETKPYNSRLKAVLIGVELKYDAEGSDFERSMLELSELVVACDIETVSILSQKLSAPVSASYVGEGKIEEIRSHMYALAADIAIFDKTLSRSEEHTSELQSR